MIVIVGAGIIGLSLALELSLRGHGARVIDRGEPARAASWAAAGMLAPISERIEHAAMQALCEESLAMYPEFAQRVAVCAGVDPHLRLDGMLHAAFSRSQFDVIAAACSAFSSCGKTARMLSREELLLLEPALSKDACGGMLVEREGQIDNRRLGRALAAACASRGVQIQTNAGGVAIEFDSRRVLGVRTHLGYIAAGSVVNAAGAWAAQLDGVPSECVPPVHAVKGQMLSIESPAGFMRRATWVPGAYFVPRHDGRVLVGATVENSEDTRVTAAGVGALLQAALAAAPSLGAFTVSESWAGLRPGTPDELPCLGATPREGYFLACGHYRNGILLAPVTARLVADAVLGKHSERLDAYSLGRFRTKAQTA
jgi:glycine oxidase